MQSKSNDLSFLDNVTQEDIFSGIVPLDASLEFFDGRTKTLEKKQKSKPKLDEACVTNSIGSSSSSTLQVYERDGEYHVYVNFMWDLMPGYPSSISLQVWLRSLPTEATVYFHINGEASADNQDWSKMLSYHDFINTIIQCKAKTYYVLDTHIRQGMAYMAIACTGIILSAVGRISFDKQLTQYDTYPAYTVLKSFIGKLLNRAVENKYLTQLELEQINANNPVTLTYEVLKARTEPGLHVVE